jgi:ATP-dependent Clp protease ATP-binding subunit ClpC
MTSNLGARNIVSPKKLGFTKDENKDQEYSNMKKSVMDEVKKLFKPEFLNRIDEAIVFHTLNQENIESIVGIMFKQLAKRMFDNLKIVVEMTPEAKKYIAKEGFDEAYGARPLKRAIQSKIEDRLAEEILDGKINEGDKVKVHVENESIVIQN